jgi:N-acetylneuraminic acid mutarotase
MRANNPRFAVGILLVVKVRHWLFCALMGFPLAVLCLAQSTATRSTGAWTWVGGGDTIHQPGDYGKLGKFARGKVPPSREGAVSWTDKRGDLWLFGGTGDPATDAFGVPLNDLWEFDPNLKEWAWIGGSNGSDTEGEPQDGVHGSLGKPGRENIPGTRSYAVGWTGKDGNLWLFGGLGCCDAAGDGVDLNDLWEYAPGTHEWTWMGGNNPAGENGGRPGVYGNLGAPAPGNTPGSRWGAVVWTDQKGNLWLFGGEGFDANGVQGSLNDLWEYEPALHEWAWMGGNKTVPKSGEGWPGAYGTLGEPAPGNMPGGRSRAAGRTDRDGNLWLFGGDGIDANGASATLNDLWKWSPATRAWTWMGGSATSTGCSGSSSPSQGSFIHCTGRPGVYGALGVSAASNIPSARSEAAAWTDGAGNFWLFGGSGFDAAQNGGNLNDLWRFSPSSNRWTWMGGNPVAGNCQHAPEPGIFCNGQPGIYGILGTRDLKNAPGGRSSAAAWKDNAGNFWLFGGSGVGRVGKDAGPLNDLWEYRVGAAD